MQVLFEGLEASFNSNLLFCILGQPHTLLQRVKACTSEEDQEKLMQITSLHSLNAFLLPIKTVGVQVQGSFWAVLGILSPGAACGKHPCCSRAGNRAWLRNGNLQVAVGELGSLSSVPGALWGIVHPWGGCSLTTSPPSSAVTLLPPPRLRSAWQCWVKIPLSAFGGCCPLQCFSLLC